MTDRATHKAYRFFKEHNGYATPPGRAACALQSARAERLLERATALDAATVTWEHDDEPMADMFDMPAEEVYDNFSSGRWTGPYGCVLTVGGETVASLGGIVFGPQDLWDPYARCVVANLALECEDELRQAIGDAEDAVEEIAFS